MPHISFKVLAAPGETWPESSILSLLKKLIKNGCTDGREYLNINDVQNFILATMSRNASLYEDGIPICSPTRTSTLGKYDLHRFEYQEGSPNLVLSFGQGLEGQPVFIINAHIDVVTSDPDCWCLRFGFRNPHSGATDEDYVYGRGSFDMLTQVVTWLTAAIKFANDTPDSEIPGRIIVMIVSNEEQGGELGTKKLMEEFESEKPLAHYIPSGSNVYAIVEGGGFQIPTKTDEIRLMVASAEKGASVVTVTVPVKEETSFADRPENDAPKTNNSNIYKFSIQIPGGAGHAALVPPEDSPIFRATKLIQILAQHGYTTRAISASKTAINTVTPYEIIEGTFESNNKEEAKIQLEALVNNTLGDSPTATIFSDDKNSLSNTSIATATTAIDSCRSMRLPIISDPTLWKSALDGLGKSRLIQYLLGSYIGIKLLSLFPTLPPYQIFLAINTELKKLQNACTMFTSSTFVPTSLTLEGQNLILQANCRLIQAKDNVSATQEILEQLKIQLEGLNYKTEVKEYRPFNESPIDPNFMKLLKQASAHGLGVSEDLVSLWPILLPGGTDGAHIRAFLIKRHKIIEQTKMKTPQMGTVMSWGCFYEDYLVARACFHSPTDEKVERRSIKANYEAMSHLLNHFFSTMTTLHRSDPLI